MLPYFNVVLVFTEDIVMESDSDTSDDIAATKCLNASIGDAFRMPFEAVDKCIVKWIKLLHALDQPAEVYGRKEPCSCTKGAGPGKKEQWHEILKMLPTFA